MKKRFLAVLAVLMMVFGGLAVGAPAYAATPCKSGTSVLHFDCDAEGIVGILGLVLTILTYGVGVLAIGALVFAGIRYSMAGGSEEKTREAKKMIFNTVIGLLCYAVLWTFMKWLVLGWD
jgi:zinc transporter ZupT